MQLWSAQTAASVVCLLAAAGGCVAADAARVRLQGSELRIGQERFIVRGVAYSNAAIGERAGATLASAPCRWARDLPLIAALGANTVRTRALLPGDDSIFLSLLESNGLYWLAGFPLEPFYDPTQTITARRPAILAAFRDYARRFRGQKRLIGYVFGDEITPTYGQKFAGSSEEFFALLAEAAEVVRELEPEDPPLVTTAVSDTAELARNPAGLSFWCWNANPGRSFEGRLEEARRQAAKPVLISEFGVDAFDERRRQEDEQTQAEVASQLAREIASAGWLLGGIYTGFLDEWWREGPDPSRHSAAGTRHPESPDGFRNEGWMGIFRVAATEQPGLDSLSARAVFGALARLWGGAPSATAADVPRLANFENAASGAELAAPGALVRVSGERLAGTVTTGQSWPLHLGTTCLCLGGTPARLGMSAPAELSAQVPPTLAPGEIKALAYRAGVAGNALPVLLRRYAPGIFPRGVVWAGSNCVASQQNGARPGDWLEVYATGLGTANADAMQADLAGRPLRVSYAGLLEGAVGVHQVNLQVPPAMGRTRDSGLRLQVGGISSNLYPLSVAGAEDRPGIALRPSVAELMIQAGGEPGTVTVEVEGSNAFCGAVLFQAVRAPEGIAFEIPVAFPGQRVPLAVRAAPRTPALADSPLILTGYSGGASGQLTLRLTVLPDQGDILVRVVSGGFVAGSLARIDWNGRTLFSTTGGGPGRGLNVISVNPVSGAFSAVRSFDTWGDEQASAALAAHLTSLPQGTLVLMAVADEATYRLSDDTRTAIASWFGSQAIRTLGYQHSWALIGRKGALKPLAEGASPDRQVVLERILTLPQP